MTKHLHLWSAAPIAAAFLTGPASGQPATDNGEEQETPFDEARLFFELNHTDGDLGIHALIDGDAWKRLEIDGPNDVNAARGIRPQSLAEAGPHGVLLRKRGTAVR